MQAMTTIAGRAVTLTVALRPRHAAAGAVDVAVTSLGLTAVWLLL